MPEVNPQEKLTAEGVYKRLEEMVGVKVKEVREHFEAKLDEQQKREHSLVDALVSQSKAVAALDPNAKKNRGMKLARFARCLAAAKGHTGLAADIAKKHMKDDIVAKALGESSLSGGGAMVPPDFVAEVIEALRDVSTVMQFNPIFLPMPNGNLSVPFVGTGITASYVGENTNQSSTAPTLGQLQLAAKKLMAIVASSNDLLRDGGPEVDRMIRDDMVGAFAEKSDSVFLRGNGLQSQPKGLLYWAGSAAATSNRFASANTAATADGSTLVEITNDLGKTIQKVLDGKLKLLDPMRAGWIFSNRTWRKLATVRDGNGNLVFGPEMKDGTLFGYKWARTSQIPNNLGGGTDSSEVYFASFGEGVIVAETNDMTLEAFPGGAYYDGSNVVSGISQDQTVIQGIMRHDFGCRYRGAEVAVIESVRWGA